MNGDTGKNMLYSSLIYILIFIAFIVILTYSVLVTSNFYVSSKYYEVAQRSADLISENKEIVPELQKEQINDLETTKWFSKTPVIKIYGSKLTNNSVDTELVATIKDSVNGKIDMSQYFSVRVDVVSGDDTGLSKLLKYLGKDDSVFCTGSGEAVIDGKLF